MIFGGPRHPSVSGPHSTINEINVEKGGPLPQTPFEGTGKIAS